MQKEDWFWFVELRFYFLNKKHTHELITLDI